MTKKDFEAIADILAGDYATCTNDVERFKVRGIAFSLADYFRQNYPHFERLKFYLRVGM